MAITNFLTSMDIPNHEHREREWKRIYPIMADDVPTRHHKLRKKTPNVRNELPLLELLANDVP